MDMAVFIMGTTRGGAMEEITRNVKRMVEATGVIGYEMDLSDPQSIPKLGQAINGQNVLFIFSFVAIGRDLMLKDPRGHLVNAWDLLGIPFLTIHGDSPAYFFDRHVNINPRFASFYGFPEHLALRKQLPNKTGLLGASPPIVIDPVDEHEIDFTAKESGKLVFLKNAGDPKQLEALWKRICSPAIYTFLMDSARTLTATINTALGLDIDAFVRTQMAERGYDLEGMTNLRLFLIAQLDDYLRRTKVTLVAEVLSEFPIEIHGDNWDYMDFSGKKCTVIPGSNFKASRTVIRQCLGVIDMSPNTSDAFHDRPQRAYGSHTLCITNEQNCVTNLFGANAGITYQFEADSIRERISAVLANPKDYVARGRDNARVYRERYPGEHMAKFLLDAAEMSVVGAGKDYPGTQDFFVWPKSTQKM